MTPDECADAIIAAFRDLDGTMQKYPRGFAPRTFLIDMIRTAVAEELERNCKAICLSCRAGHPIRSDGDRVAHTDKDGAGGLWTCDAATIRAQP